MTHYTQALLAILILLLLWTIASLFFNNVASPAYTVLEKRDGYEIRLYEPYLTAQVEMTGTYNEAMTSGFSILADYIFGNNTKQTSITMTAPVLETGSEKISMTAPVLERTDDQTRTISFVMPFEYTLETLPKPNNPAVQIVPQAARKVAVLKFSWWRTATRIERKKQDLMTRITQDKLEPLAMPEYAGYNAPFTAPWLNRNEILIEIK